MFENGGMGVFLIESGPKSVDFLSLERISVGFVGYVCEKTNFWKERVE